MTLAVLAMALLIAAAVIANPTQAQGLPGTEGTPGTGGGNTDDGNNPPGGNADAAYPNDNTYPDPQPCGPGAGTAFMEEPHEIQTGHYALFDAYWRIPPSTGGEGTSTGGGETSGSTSTDGLLGSGTAGQGGSGPDTTTAGVGVLHTNLCPPEVMQTTTTVTVEGKQKPKR